MSDRPPEVGIFAPILLLAVFAANFEKIAARFSRYWDLHIAPTINFIFYVILWLGLIAFGIFLGCLILREIYRYCSVRRIVLKVHFNKLIKENSELRSSYEAAMNRIERCSNENWHLSNELEKLRDELAKATAKPESVIDAIVKDVIGEHNHD